MIANKPLLKNWETLLLIIMDGRGKHTDKEGVHRARGCVNSGGASSNSSGENSGGLSTNSGGVNSGGANS